MKKRTLDPISRLRDTTRSIRPDEAWVQSTRGLLLSEARRDIQNRPKKPTSQKWLELFSSRMQTIRGPALAIFGVLVLALGGSVASVSAAEQSLPGDFLYSLKLATEQARLAFKQEKNEKLKLKVEFTSRRGRDLQQVVTDPPNDKKEKRIEQATELLKRDLDTVKQQLDAVQKESSPTETVAAAKLVDEKSTELFQALNQSNDALSEQVQNKVREAQTAAVSTGGKAVEVLVDAHQANEQSVSEQDVVTAIEGYAKTVKDLTGIDVDIANTASSSTTVISTTTSTTVDGVTTTSTTTTSAPLPLKETFEQIQIATEIAIAQSQLVKTTSTTSGVLAPSDTTGSTSTSVTTSSTSADSTTSGVSTSTPSPP